MLARLHGKAVNPDQLKHTLAIQGPSTLEDLLRVCKLLAFKARAIPLSVLKLDQTRAAKPPLPCIVETKQGLRVLAAVNLNASPQVLLHDPILGRPVGQTLEQFNALLNPGARVLLVTSRSGLAAQSEGGNVPVH
jgi:ABC-type bacteriocin/lantibiotic exporter with double-glycine peptidase domain